MASTDWSKYVGIPYHPTDFNCWNLCRLVYLDALGISLSAQQVAGDDVREVLTSFKSSPEFSNWQQVDSPRPLDLVLFGMGKSVHHVGVQTDIGVVLHCVKGMGSILSTRKHLDVMGYRQKSVWRYRNG